RTPSTLSTPSDTEIQPLMRPSPNLNSAADALSLIVTPMKYSLPACYRIARGVARRSVARLCVGERVRGVVGHGPAAEPPDSVDLDEVAVVLAGRQGSRLAVAGNRHEQIGGGVRPIAVQLNGNIADYVTELGSGSAPLGEPTSKRTHGV